MSIKKFILLLTFAFSIQVLSINVSSAFNPEWKDDQKAIFDKLQIKPGDIINKSNFDKVKDLVPAGVLNWVKNGEWQLKIGQFEFDYSPDQEFIEAGKKNVGKYALNQKGVVVDAKTGEIPNFIYGYPFPDADPDNDPMGAIKLMHNQDAANSRGGSQYNRGAAMDWIGMGGFERANVLEWIKYSFWQRADGEQPNPLKYKFMEMIPVTKPYDSKGVVSMFYRQSNGDPDIVYTYIPAIRRVKRMSGANRSDPTLGSDTCMDDAGGWSGDNSSMKWKYMGEKIFLFPISEWASKTTRKMVQLPNGTWDQVPGVEPETLVGYNVPDSKGVPWELVNIVWIPRKVYMVEAIPLDPYYTYGKTDIYVDKESMTVSIKTIYDKAMDYWKIAIVGAPCVEWGNRKSFNSTNFSMGIDDKTHHASNVFAGGKHGENPETLTSFYNPEVNREMFTPGALRMWSK